jgi:hypothetical protein
VASDAEGARRAVGGDHPPAGRFRSEGKGDGARAGSDVDGDGRRGATLEGEVEQELSFGSRDEDVWRDDEVEVTKGLVAGQVGDRLTGGAAGDERPVGGKLPRVDRTAALREQTSPRQAEDVHQQPFCRHPSFVVARGGERRVASAQRLIDRQR